VNPLETRTRALRDGGRKILAPYVTGAVTADWTDHLRAAVDAGADVVEIGLPFSDPMLDGPTVQRASDRALARGATVDGILAELARLDLGVPLSAMTYANLVFRRGMQRFCGALRDAGVSGLIVPDVPLDEVEQLSAAAAAEGVDLVLLASPSTGAQRRREIAKRSRGFVYAVSVMATTGEQQQALPESAGQLARSLQEATDLPVLLGFGVSSAAGAAAAAARADGVIVGSTLMRRVLDGASPADIGVCLAEMRTALDTGGD
jgi:tryptophan synthase alpha chain